MHVFAADQPLVDIRLQRAIAMPEDSAQAQAVQRARAVIVDRSRPPRDEILNVAEQRSRPAGPSG